MDVTMDINGCFIAVLTIVVLCLPVVLVCSLLLFGSSCVGGSFIPNDPCDHTFCT